MKTRPNFRGMTLVEVLVAMSLFSLLAATALGLMSYSSKLLQRSQSRSDHNRALNRLYIDLTERFYHTSYAYQSVEQNGDVLVLASARDEDRHFHTDAQGYPRWLAWERLFVQGDRLHVFRQDNPNIGKPGKMTTARTGSRDQTILANNVESFHAQINPDDSVNVTIKWEHEIDSTPTVWTFHAGQGGTL